MEKIRLMPTSLPAVINLEEVLTARSSYKTDHFTHFNAKEHTSYFVLNNDCQQEMAQVGLHKFFTNCTGSRCKSCSNFFFRCDSIS